MKVAVITCHNQPDYIRAVTLRQAFAAQSDTEVIVLKNNHRNVIRYPEMIFRVISLRFKGRPDTYVLTFRGYELLPFLCVLSWPKTLIYDEFINPIEWLNEPRKETWAKLIPKSILKPFYRVLLKRCRWILADTESHAKYSANLMKLPATKYKALPVSCDEEAFKPINASDNKLNDSKATFRVFYYGNMLALHGLNIVLDAALRLKEYPIEFRIIGGKKDMTNLVLEAKANGASINYTAWVDFSEIPNEISQANLCLGGPFGDTPQSQRVVTGKTYQFLASAAATVVGKNLANASFKNKINCLSIPLNDAEALTDAIVWSLENPNKLGSIAKNGRKLYEDEFSIKRLSQQVADLL